MQAPSRFQFSLKKLFLAMTFAAVLLVWCQTLWSQTDRWTYLLPLGFGTLTCFFLVCFALVLAILFVHTPGQESQAIGWLALAWLVALFDAAFGIFSLSWLHGLLSPGYYMQREMRFEILRALLLPLAGTFLVLLAGSPRAVTHNVVRKALLLVITLIVIDLLVFTLFSRRIFEEVIRQWNIRHPDAVEIRPDQVPEDFED